MEKIKLTCMAIVLLAIMIVFSNSVFARGGYVGHSHSHSRTNLGIHIGGGYYGGFWGPGYYGYYGDPFFYPPFYAFPPAYAYPPVVVAPPASPPVYIEQESAAPAQPQANYWYYCRNPEGYYPYIKQCPEGWLKVVPQPGQ